MKKSWAVLSFFIFFLVFLIAGVLAQECNNFIRGDSNNDEVVDISDAVIILSYLFKNPDAKIDKNAADVNSDSRVDISDAVYLLQYLFARGSPPKGPFPNPDNCKNGLIVISADASGKDYANQIATEKDWGFIALQNPTVDSVKTAIREFYNENHNNFLLIIGTNEEITYAQPKPGYTQDSDGYGSFDTDPSMYGDVNDDGFLEMSIGRLPFSSNEELRKYFNDLGPKGQNYYFEHYPLAVTGDDPLDENTVKDFTYYNCLRSDLSSISVFKNSDFDTLVSHYKSATVLQVKTHGESDFYSIHDPLSLNTFSIDSLCAGCRGLTSFNDPPCSCETPQYLSNRPILIHLTCKTARGLGLQLIKNGASAFIGSYVIGDVNSKSLAQDILSGAYIGDAFKKAYNSGIPLEALVDRGGWEQTIANVEGLNNFDVRNTLTKNFNPAGLILYGDPSLKLQNPPGFTPSIEVTKVQNAININIEPSSLFDIDLKNSLLCYTGRYIRAGSFINKDYWGEATNFGASHFIHLTIPLKNVNEVTGAKAVIDGQEIILPTTKEGEIYYGTYKVNLIKGGSEEVLYIAINDPALGYDKNTKIVISYN